MLEDHLEIYETVDGSFTYQCPTCGLKKRLTVPEKQSFKIKCLKCNTVVPIKLNSRGKYRKETNIPAIAFKDQRKSLRKDVRFKGVLTTSSIRFYVVIKDMSINGMKCYFNSDNYRLHVGEKISIDYTLKIASDSIHLVDSCVVKWIKGDYFGVACEELPDFSKPKKFKGFFVMPPEVESLEMAY